VPAAQLAGELPLEGLELKALLEEQHDGKRRRQLAAKR
jgi:hypothetical protein